MHNTPHLFFLVSERIYWSLWSSTFILLIMIIIIAAAAAKLLQSCPTLCNPIDSSPSGFPVPGILQARTLEWVAISFSNAWKWKVKVKSLSRVWLVATPWTAAYQAPPLMGFSRQEYWSGVPNVSLEAGKGKEMYSPLGPPEGAQPCWHVGLGEVKLSGLLASRIIRE